MARAAKSPKTKTKPAPAKITSKPTKPAKNPAKAVKTVKTPKLSVAELRAKVEKLERANATLRTKSREAGRASKAATARIAELEDHVTSLEKKLAKTAAPTKSNPPAARAKRKTRETVSPDAAPLNPDEEIAEGPSTPE